MKSSGLGRPRVLIIQLVLGVALLLVVSAALTSSSGACARCHAMRPFADSLARTRHAGVGCYSCHLSSAPWGFAEAKSAEFFRMYPAALRGAGVQGPVQPVQDAECLTCHRDVLTSNTVNGRIRIQHASCASGSTCVTCHSNVGHAEAGRWARKPDMARCLACHKARNATDDCDACHTGRSGEKRLQTGAWSVTHGASWERTHGMGDMRSCDACHPKDYCVRCHGTPLPHGDGFFRMHGTDAKAKKADCRRCHRQGFCDACHGMAMPHPAGFQKGHSALARGRDDARCLKCHEADDCAACHAAHTHPGKTDGTLGGGALPATKGGGR